MSCSWLIYVLIQDLWLREVLKGGVSLHPVLSFAHQMENLALGYICCEKMQALVLPWTTCLSRAVTLVMESSSPQRCLWVSCLWAWPLGCSSLRPQGKKWWSESGRAKLVYDRPILPDHTMVKCCPQVSRFLPGGALAQWHAAIPFPKQSCCCALGRYTQTGGCPSLIKP